MPPVPGAQQLPRLVEQLRQVGTDIGLVVGGDLRALPDTTGSTVYRITQEALTNAAKHAPGAAVEVRVDVTGDAVHLSVDSAGAPREGMGMGLDGMRERARAVGGTCTAGPGGRGWLVQAALPLLTGRPAGKP